MDHLSDLQREDLWYELSYVFADEMKFVDFSKFDGIELSALEEIFFNEVAFHCAPFFYIVTPIMGEGFFREDMIPDIRSKLIRRKKSVFIQLIDKFYAFKWRYDFQKNWKSFVAKLNEYRESLEQEDAAKKEGAAK